MEEYHELRMQTLGSFSLRYGDISLTASGKKSESQFFSLLQILLHNQEEGVEKSTLETLLFGSRELDNTAHTLQSVIYNSKKRLRECGLPPVDYIVQRKGIYYWCEEIPVREDAKEFERAAEEAFAERKTAVKEEKLLEAMYLYQGDFLPKQNTVPWISEASWKYRKLFRKVIEEISHLARENKNYALLEQAGLYASSVAPLEDFEELTMEAYVSLGKYEDARKLYLDTSDLYIKMQETLPSNKIGELLNSLSKQIEYPHNIIENIEADLYENISEEESGGYECTYPTFVGIYRSLYHINQRRGEPVYLMLCTIVDSKGNLMRNTPKLQELSDRLGEVIKGSIRKSDIVNRYGMAQYLVLLSNTTLENCYKIQKRINAGFMENRQRIHVKYSVMDIYSGKTEKKPT